MESTTDWKKRLKNWTDVERLRQHENKVLLALTLLIGVVVGLVVVAFILITETLSSSMYPVGGAAWRRVLLPILGSLITGILLYKYFPNSRGSGIPQTKTALFIYDGYISFRTVIGKFCCSAISLASGIALGREGPSVQVGAGIGSVLGQRLGLSQSKIRALVPVACSAALAAAFNTPIAAVLFTLEEILGDLHAPVLGSIVLSSATAWITLRLVLGDEPLFHVPAYQLVHPVEFIVYAALGVIGGLVSVGFVKLLLWLRKRFLGLPKRTAWLQPVAGGLLVGLLAWFVPDVLGVGYGHVGEALNGQIALRLMVLLVVLKILATATCYASGNSGGIFGPSLFIGAMLGGAVGGGAHYLLPDYTGSVGAYALVGMGTAFAGIIRVPLTSVIMIFEVTRDYSIIVPLMISNLISYFISHKLQRESIYEALLHQEDIYLPPGGGSHRDMLIAEQAMQSQAEALASEQSIVVYSRLLADQDRSAWPVVSDGVLLGMISRTQLEQALQESDVYKTIGDVLPAHNPKARITIEEFPHVHADQPLDTVLKRMAETNLNVLPVVSRANLRKLVGTVSLNDVMRAYGLAEGESAKSQHSPEAISSSRSLVGILVAVLSLFILTGFLIHYYHTERREKAQEYSQAGNRLVQQGRNQEAIEQFRNALSISHSNQDRVSLAFSLVKVGRLNEAALYLQEVLKEDSNSAIANLGLARIAAAQEKSPDAVNYYHRAIFGTWPPKSIQSRIQAWFELVDVLATSGSEKQASTELLALLETTQNDWNTKKRIGHLLLKYGAAKESSEVFRDVLRQQQQDAESFAGLGDAEFAQGNYFAAQRAFGNALRLTPNDQHSRERLQLCDRIIGIDPTLRGLPSTERYRRSQELVQGTLREMEKCAASSGESPDGDSIQALIAEAHKLLSNLRKPPSYGDAAEANIALAVKLQTSRGKLCQRVDDGDEALALVLSGLSK